MPSITYCQVRTSARYPELVTHCTATTRDATRPVSIVGSDRISFEATYLAIRSLIQSESDRFDAYVSDTPYQIQGQKWIASVYRQYLSETDELVSGVLAGIQASKNRITRRGAEVTPARVFAHVVFLDQYGLLPRYDPLIRGGGRGLSEICAKYFDVRPVELES